MSACGSKPQAVTPKVCAGPTVRRRILLVEGDPVTAQVVDRALTARGYDVSLARDGMQALHALMRGRPDLVILDLDLRVVPGVEVLQRLCSDSDPLAPSVVVYTAVDRERVGASVEGCAPDAWVQKRRGPRQLVSSVDELMAQG